MLKTHLLIPQFDSILSVNRCEVLPCSLRNLKFDRGLPKEEILGKRQILVPDTYASTNCSLQKDSSQGDAVGTSPSVQLRRSLDPGDFPRRSPPGSKLRLSVGSPFRSLPLQRSLVKVAARPSQRSVQEPRVSPRHDAAPPPRGCQRRPLRTRTG